jgi:hypothetical protein
VELDRNEHSIFGFFPSSGSAMRAMEAIKNANLVENEGSIQMDKISRFGVVNDSQYNNPINNAVTQHGPTHYSNSEGIDNGPNPLLAANDSESGRGINNDNLAGESFMVTMVTSNENIQKAVAILKEHGGKV